MLLLAIETSCDQTSAAVVHNGAVGSNNVSSQARLHAEYGGVVPELAERKLLHGAGVTDYDAEIAPDWALA